MLKSTSPTERVADILADKSTTAEALFKHTNKAISVLGKRICCCCCTYHFYIISAVNFSCRLYLRASLDITALSRMEEAVVVDHTRELSTQ